MSKSETTYTPEEAKQVADLLVRSTQVSSRLKMAGFCLQIGNLKISLCDDPNAIAIDRDGEGGHFSLQEFHDMVQEFVSERL